MTSKSSFLTSPVTPVTHEMYHSALVGASSAVSNVNSSAVVQVCPNMFPVQFHTIRLNTDLNHLPQDWAKTKFQCYGFHNTHESAFSPFSSVNMAHKYQDLVGKVDVISSSKNIKDLLKMPYQQSPHISLMVHRLGKTLLLEEFDVHKNLIKKDAEDWQWLNDFFRRYVQKREDKKSSLALLNSPKKDPLSDEMYRNLIRHSITASVAGNACISVETANEVPQNMAQEEETQDLKGFHHESLWKFHNRSMLVDSDLPIFGTDSKNPCISLRLRDSPPINVLTGLDYWLDNLMSNVPEVAMVYHLNGFVQKYEILRTEDIPHIENSSFDPEEVKELARNILAFIKSRAAVEGHTYWLYKDDKDDMVKLYDLTAYCKKELRKDDNPFTVPVGLLCYHVGRNLKMSGQRRSADCRAMLENCLRLLIAEKHPQVCADAHFLLSDMWVPDKSLHDIWGGDGKLPEPPDDLYDEDEMTDEYYESESGSSQREDERIKTEESNLVKMKSMSLKGKKHSAPQKSPKKRVEKNEVALQELVVRGMVKCRAWDVLKVCRIAGETDERCREALSHVRKGLNCIDKDLSRRSRPEFRERDRSPNPSQSNRTQHNGFSFKSEDIERDQIRVAKPFIPIPLHYSPIKPNTNESSSSKDSKPNTNESSSSKDSKPNTNESSSSKDSKPNTNESSSSKDSKPNTNESSSSKDSKPNTNESSSSKDSKPNTESSSSKDSKQETASNGSEMTNGFHSAEESSQQTPESDGSTSDSDSDNSWHAKLKIQLLRKAAIAFYILASQFHDSLQKRGHTLRYVRYGLHCYECYNMQGPKRDLDNLEEEIYFHLIHLAAKARSCLDSTIWASSLKDFEELNEEEAAILHSAQAILQKPKEAWVYTWSENEEKNLLAARALFRKVIKMKLFEKRTLEVRNLIGKQLAICTMNTGSVVLRELRDIAARGETFKTAEPLIERGKSYYEEALSHLINCEKGTAAHCANCIARLYEFGAECLEKNNEDRMNPICKQETEVLQKMFDAYTMTLSIYDRNESTDEAREDIYHFLRNKYFLLATRYFRMYSIDTSKSPNIFKQPKDLLQKSLKLCFLDPSRPHRKSQRIGAIVYYNLAVFNKEECKYLSMECSHYRALRRKMFDSILESFKLYIKLKWSLSMIAIKSFLSDIIFEDLETKNLSVRNQKKSIRFVLMHCCSLQDAVDLIHTDQLDEEDDCQSIESPFEAVKTVLGMMNKAFIRWLKIEKSVDVYRDVKQMYQRTLRHTAKTQVEFIAFPLSQILTDVKVLLDIDNSTSTT